MQNKKTQLNISITLKGEFGFRGTDDGRPDFLLPPPLLHLYPVFHALVPFHSSSPIPQEGSKRNSSPTLKEYLKVLILDNTSKF